MTLLQSGIAKPSSGYDIEQSLRFDHDSSSRLTKTFSSSGNRKINTLSFWIKPSLSDTRENIFAAAQDDNNRQQLYFFNNTLRLFGRTSGSNDLELYTNQVFRDPSAWYHIVISMDSTQSTAANRVKIYVNGEQVTSFSTETYWAQDYSGWWASDKEHSIATDIDSGSYAEYFGGYLAEVHFIDGTALDASSFGETDSATNQWKPVEYSGSYGTNGFYLPFSSTELATSFTDSAERSVLTVTANGNAHTDTTVKKIGTASLQLDGTGDYLSLPDNAFVIGTGDFTMEAWIKFDGAPTQAHSAFFNAGTGDGTAGAHWVLYYYTAAGAHWGWSDDGTASSEWTSNWTYDSNWHHIAVCRQSGTYRFYLDGSQQTSSTSGGSQDLSAATTNFRVGSGYGDFGGYMDEVRYSDTCRYPDGTSFTPYTSALTADVNTKLLLHCDGSDGGTTFTDSSWAGTPRHTITANGDVTNTRAQKKIGSSSIKFDGNGDYLVVSDSSDWDFGTGDFTFECWFRRSAWDTTYLWDFSDGTSRIAGHIRNDGAGTRINWFGTAWSNTTEDFESNTLNQWMHIALVRDNGVGRWYIDGVQKNTLSSWTTNFSGTWTAHIGDRYASSGSSDPWEGYIDEFRVSNSCRYPDGTTFTPSTTAFTADSNTKLLIHSDFNGGLGADNSGNTNDFTPTNLVATDVTGDSPTNNFATLNPLDFSSGTLSEGNLKWVSTGNVGNGAFGTFAFDISSTDKKYYFEVLLVSGDSVFGIVPDNVLPSNTSRPGSYTYYTDGDKYSGTSASSYGASYTSGDIIGVAVGAGSVTFYKNGTSQGAAFTGLTGDFKPAIYEVSGTFVANFGQDSSFAGNKTAQGNQDGNGIGDFYYTPPSGYLALCSDNLSDPSIADPTAHFNTVLFDGSASSKSVTGVGFSPDYVWLKSRSTNYNHRNWDTVRGADKRLSSDGNGAEVTSSDLTSFDSDGITLAGGTGSNNSGQTFVTWNWKAGGTASSITAGSIDGTNPTIPSSVSANTTAGFSIVTFTGNQTSGATVGHGLSQAPEMIIVKGTTFADNWGVYHFPGMGNTHGLLLNSTVAQIDSDTYWNDTTAGASVFTLGNDTMINKTGQTMLAYCFHSVDGYSKVGSYTGNGSSDGPMIYTGFRPAYTLIKPIDYASSWAISDSARSPYNGETYQLRADSNIAGFANSGSTIDYLSNGFKIRTSDTGLNNNTIKYLYLAFADSPGPFKYSNAR